MRPLLHASCLAVLLSLGLPLPSQTAAPSATRVPMPKGGTPYEQAFAEMQKKAYGAALPLYEKALALEPHRAEVWNEYAICLRNLRRFPASVRAGWRAIQLDGGRTVQPWQAQANTLMETREWKGAQACLEKAGTFHQDPAHLAKAWLNLAFRMQAAGSSEGVVDLCRRATRLDRHSSLAWLDLGQAQACAGETRDAITSVEKGLGLARQQKDAQQTGYAEQLLKKVKASESVRPPVAPGGAWQTLPASLVGLSEGDASQAALPTFVEHHYLLSDGGTLSLSLPEGWTEAFASELPENLFPVHYSVAGTEGFKVFFSPIKGGGNPLGVKATADEVANRLRSSSSQTELTPHELSSTTMKGYWVLATNRKPADGEYHHLLSAQLDVSGLQCVGTVLTNSKAPEVIEPCLAAFSSARRMRGSTK